MPDTPDDTTFPAPMPRLAAAAVTALGGCTPGAYVALKRSWKATTEQRNQLVREVALLKDQLKRAKEREELVYRDLGHSWDVNGGASVVEIVRLLHRRLIEDSGELEKCRDEMEEFNTSGQF